MSEETPPQGERKTVKFLAVECGEHGIQRAMKPKGSLFACMKCIRKRQSSGDSFEVTGPFIIKDGEIFKLETLGHATEKPIGKMLDDTLTVEGVLRETQIGEHRFTAPE